MRHFTLIILLFIGSALAGVAQEVQDSVSTEDRRQVEVTTLDWDVVRGTIIKQEPHSFVIRTYGGIEIVVPFEQIRAMKEIDGPSEKANQIEHPTQSDWFYNTHGYRYLASGNYLPIPRKTGYVTNTYLTTNTFRFGITDNFSIGGGFELISSLLLNPAYMISPKVGVQLGENWYGGASITYAGVLNTWIFDAGGGLGLAQLGTTLGTTERNFTAGTGWSIIDGNVSRSPFFTLGGMIRFSKRFAFITDNVLAPIDVQYVTFISYGLRYLGKRVSGEVIFVNIPALLEYTGPGVPVVSLSVTLD